MPPTALMMGFEASAPLRQWEKEKSGWVLAPAKMQRANGRLRRNMQAAPIPFNNKDSREETMFGNDSGASAMAAMAQQLWQMAQKQAVSGTAQMFSGGSMPGGFNAFAPTGANSPFGFPPTGFQPAGFQADPFAWMKPPSASAWPFPSAAPQMPQIPDFSALLKQFSQIGETFAAADPLAQLRDAFQTWTQQVAQVGQNFGQNFGENLMQGMDQNHLETLREWLKTPGVGLMREEQERWQATLLAKLEFDEASKKLMHTFQGLMQQTQQRYEKLLGEAQVAGKKPESARAAFDLWVDAGEQIWADIAMSQPFQDDLAEMTNTQMRFQKALQAQIDRAAAAAGLPSRIEVDATARKVAILEREVRSLKAQLQASANQTREAAMAAREQALGATAQRNVAESAIVVPLPVTPRAAASQSTGEDAASRKHAPHRAIKAAKPKTAKPAKAARRDAQATTVALFPLVDAPRAFGRKLAEPASRAVTTKPDHRAKRKAAK